MSRGLHEQVARPQASQHGNARSTNDFEQRKCDIGQGFSAARLTRDESRNLDGDVCHGFLLEMTMSPL
jgi:hypothetical protein